MTTGGRWSGERAGKSGELFGWDPVAYRLDRRSALKMELRRALSKKLAEFLGDFADETLVEYVVVLLCNGKDQYQAREGLMDFLGDETDSFVAWLWNYMSRKADAVKKSGCSAPKCKRMEVQRPSSEVWAHVGDASLDNEVLGKKLKHYSGSQKDLHGSVVHEFSLRQEEDLHGGLSSRRSLQKKLRASDEDWVEEEPPISKPRGISSLAAECVPFSPCPDEIWHCKRREKPLLSTRPSRSLPGPRSNVVAMGRNINSSNRETLGIKHSEKLPKLAVDRIEKELKPLHRNVWDRLGKPQNETNNPSLKERLNCFALASSANLPHIHPPLTQNLPSSPPLLPHARANFVSTSLYPEGVIRATPLCTQVRANGENVTKLKRQFEQIENHIRASVVTSKPVERIPAKKRLGICLVAPQSLPQSNCFSSNMADEAIVVDGGLQPENVKKAESASSDQRAPSTPTEEGELKISESGESQEAPSKVSDTIAKLEEMKNDMQELPLKQAQLEDLEPVSETNTSPGAQPSLMEDMDSRTVVVTNVHFGATKEAIVSHFAKCGPVTKAVMLRDSITGKPKGTACVTFAQKESVEKAILLSGTSLFSRILKVMRKADAPAGLTETQLMPHQVWKQAQSLHLPLPIWNSPHCYPSVTHLQWRRETNPSVLK